MAIENVAQCIQAGNCIVMEKIAFYAMASIAGLAAVFIVLLFLIGFFTPALIFLQAKFKKGASLIYTVNRGQIGEFKIATGKFQGIADVKKVGPYIITENSHTIEKKSKTPFYFAFGEFAATLPLEYSFVIQYLRETGEKVTNIDDLGDLVGVQYNEEEKLWESKPKEEKDDSDFEKEERMKVAIEPYKTIKIHDLAYMFPFNITPALVESKTQHMIGLKMSMFNKMNIQYVLMFIMILMGTTLAVILAVRFIKTGDTTGTVETRTIIERVVQAGGIQNLTG